MIKFKKEADYINGKVFLRFLADFVRLTAMSINIEVEKTGSETSASLLRRFSKRVLGAGIIQKIKTRRYKERAQSKYKVKARTLKSLEHRKQTEKLIRLGKISPRY